MEDNQKVKEISLEEAQALDANTVAYYTLTDGTVVVIRKDKPEITKKVSETKTREVTVQPETVKKVDLNTPQVHKPYQGKPTTEEVSLKNNEAYIQQPNLGNEVYEIPPKNNLNYTPRYSNAEYSSYRRRTRTPVQRTSYGGIVEERPNYTFYASGIGTIGGDEINENVNYSRTYNVTETTPIQRAVSNTQQVEVSVPIDERQCTCVPCSECPVCSRTLVQSKTEVVRSQNVTGGPSPCPLCGEYHKMKSSVNQTSSIRQTNNMRAIKQPVVQKKQLYKVIEAVPVRLSEYEKVDYVEEQPFEPASVNNLRSVKQEEIVETRNSGCPYCQRCTGYTEECLKCSKCGGVHNENYNNYREEGYSRVIRSSRKYPDYLDNYRFHEINESGNFRRSKSQARYHF